MSQTKHSEVSESHLTLLLIFFIHLSRLSCGRGVNGTWHAPGSCAAIGDTAGRGGGMCVFLGVFAWRTGTEGLACWERKKGRRWSRLKISEELAPWRGPHNIWLLKRYRRLLPRPKYSHPNWSRLRYLSESWGTPARDGFPRFWILHFWMREHGPCSTTSRIGFQTLQTPAGGHLPRQCINVASTFALGLSWFVVLSTLRNGLR